MKIFISYTEADKDIVQKFEEKLRNSDDKTSWSVWRDIHILKSGDTFRQKIYRGILDCDIFIPFLSESSIMAIGVIKEIHSALLHRYAIEEKSPNYFKPLFIKRKTNTSLESLLGNIDKNENLWQKLVKEILEEIKGIQYSTANEDSVESDMDAFYKSLVGVISRNELWVKSGYCKFQEDGNWIATYKQHYPTVVARFLKNGETLREVIAKFTFDESKNENTRVGISLRSDRGNPKDELFCFHISKNQHEQPPKNKVATYYALDSGRVNCISDVRNRPRVGFQQENTLGIKVLESRIACYFNDSEPIFLLNDSEVNFKIEDVREVQFMVWADGENFEIKFHECIVTI